MFQGLSIFQSTDQRAESRLRKTQLKLHVFAYLEPDLRCPYTHRAYHDPNGGYGSYYTKDTVKIHRLRVDQDEKIRLISALDALARKANQRSAASEHTPLLRGSIQTNGRETSM